MASGSAGGVTLAQRRAWIRVRPPKLYCLCNTVMPCHRGRIGGPRRQIADCIVPLSVYAVPRLKSFRKADPVTGQTMRSDPTDSAFDAMQMRRNMVASQLRPSDVSDPVVIAAMSVVPRETFVPEEYRSTAYMDRAIPLGGGRYLNPPLATGLLLTRADISARDKVLLIGAGTGYTAALLSGIAESVVALDEDAALLGHARTALAGQSNVTVVKGPLAEGHPGQAPYDLIVIEGAAEHIPDALAAQLADDGRLVAGTVENGVTRLAIGRKGGGSLVLTDFADGDIAPLAAFAKPKTYSF